MSMEKFGVVANESEEPKKEEVSVKDLLKKQRKADRKKKIANSVEGSVPSPTVYPGNSTTGKGIKYK